MSEYSPRLEEAIKKAETVSQSQQSVIFHRPEQDGEGVRLSDGRVSLWAGGEELISTQAEISGSLDELMASYQLCQLFPSFEFSFTGELVEWDLEIDVALSSQDAVLLGELSVLAGSQNVGESGLWEAQRAKGPVFKFSDLELELRPWLSSETASGEGWALTLPLFVSAHPDPVLRKRAAAAVEAFIYALQAQRELTLPYRRRVNNVFSASRPIWIENTPVLWKEL